MLGLTYKLVNATRQQTKPLDQTRFLQLFLALAMAKVIHDITIQPEDMEENKLHNSKQDGESQIHIKWNLKSNCNDKLLEKQGI